MSWRRLLPFLAVVLLPGCHRLTGHHGVAGVLRHGAGLNVASSISLALCAVAALGGLCLAFDGISRPERTDLAQGLWGVFLLALAAGVALSLRSDFRYLRACC